MGIYPMYIMKDHLYTELNASLNPGRHVQCIERPLVLTYPREYSVLT